MENYRNFFDDNELANKLEELHKKKVELREKILDINPNILYVVELSGLPRTGKTVTLERLYDFFKMGNYKIQKGEEPAFIIKSELSLEEIKKMSNLDFNDKTLEVSRKSLSKTKKVKPTIILMDRGVIDNYFWYQMMYDNDEISAEVYFNRMGTLNKDLKEVDQLHILTADPFEVIKRDYQNQIYLESRTKTTLPRVRALKESYETLLQKMSGSKDKIYKIDTTDLSAVDTSIVIADSIMDGMSKKLELSNT